MNEIELFIERLKKVQDFGFYFESCETSTIQKHTIDGLTLELLIEFEVHVLNCQSATYSNPEEADFETEIKSFSEIALYKGAEFIELNEAQLHSIDVAVSEIFFNQNLKQ